MPHFVKLDRPTPWRLLASTAWSPPTDPTIHGVLEVDYTAIGAFLDKVRKVSGERVTLTHFLAKVVGLALREYPLLNSVLRWDGFYLRQSIDISILASRDETEIQDGGGLSGVKIENADSKTIPAICRELKSKVALVRSHVDPGLDPLLKTLSWIPRALLRPVLNLVDLISFQLDLDLTRLGMIYDPFGSAIITNVGMLGLTAGFAPFFPYAHCPLLIVVHEIQDKPLAMGRRVKVRPVLSLGCTVDHRFIDGVGASRMHRRLKEILADPATALRGELVSRKPRRKAPPRPRPGKATR